jgi:hypothetical protein
MLDLGCISGLTLNLMKEFSNRVLKENLGSGSRITSGLLVLLRSLGSWSMLMLEYFRLPWVRVSCAIFTTWIPKLMLYECKSAQSKIKRKHMKLKYLFTSVIIFCLTACIAPPKVINTSPITAIEINNVFDLFEFGTRTVDSEGHVFLGGRQVDPALMVGIGYGRKGNYLGLSPAILVALEPNLRSSALSASPDQLRSFLTTYKLTVIDVRNQQNELRELDASGLRALALLSQQRMGSSASSPSFICQMNIILHQACLN